jgi:glutamyl-tRNA synthetase
LVDDFQIDAFSSSPTIYDAQELWLLNHKLLINLDYSDIADELKKIGADKVDAQFWLAVRGNLNNLKEVKLWWDVCKTHPKLDAELDQDFLNIAAKLLPQGTLDEATWSIWTGSISQETGKKGRGLFMPLRLALTGMDHGPEMKMLLPLIDREEVLKRLNSVMKMSSIIGFIPKVSAVHTYYSILQKKSAHKSVRCCFNVVVGLLKCSNHSLSLKPHAQQ